MDAWFYLYPGQLYISPKYINRNSYSVGAEARIVEKIVLGPIQRAQKR